MQQKPPRPTGVTVLAVLSLLGGLGSLAIGGLLLAAAAIVNTLNLTTSYPQLATYNLTTGTVAAILGVFGAVLLILGILYLVLGIGFLGGKGWAWGLGIALAVISIVFDISSVFLLNSTGNVFGIIVSIIIIYYLTRTHVKVFFGKASGTVPSTGGMMSAAPMGSTSSSSMGGMIKCRACGAMAPAGSTKCPSCGAML